MLEELARRVEEAEKQFQAEDLDQRLKDLVAAKQRQVQEIGLVHKQGNEPRSYLTIG